MLELGGTSTVASIQCVEGPSWKWSGSSVKVRCMASARKSPWAESGGGGWVGSLEA